MKFKLEWIFFSLMYAVVIERVAETKGNNDKRATFLKTLSHKRKSNAAHYPTAKCNSSSILWSIMHWSYREIANSIHTSYRFRPFPSKHLLDNICQRLPKYDGILWNIIRKEDWGAYQGTRDQGTPLVLQSNTQYILGQSGGFTGSLEEEGLVIIKRDTYVPTYLCRQLEFHIMIWITF